MSMAFSAYCPGTLMPLPIGLNVDRPAYPVANRHAHLCQSTTGAGRFPFYPQRRLRDIKTSMAKTENPQIQKNQFLVFVPPHPLIKHWISVLRNESTPSPMFSNSPSPHLAFGIWDVEGGALAELGRILIYEASRDWLVTVTGDLQTPCGTANVEFIDPREPVKVIPILRAGLVLVDHLSTVLPATQTYHLGYVRDEVTLQPSCYLNKLPAKFPETSRVLVADPVLATGGTIVAAMEELKKRGVDHRLIRVVTAVAAPPALKKLSEKFPGLRVYTGIIDPELNDKGYIVPGIGDAGDRSFGT